MQSIFNSQPKRYPDPFSPDLPLQSWKELDVLRLCDIKYYSVYPIRLNDGNFSTDGIYGIYGDNKKCIIFGQHTEYKPHGVARVIDRWNNIFEG